MAPSPSQGHAARRVSHAAALLRILCARTPPPPECCALPSRATGTLLLHCTADGRQCLARSKCLDLGRAAVGLWAPPASAVPATAPTTRRAARGRARQCVCLVARRSKRRGEASGGTKAPEQGPSLHPPPHSSRPRHVAAIRRPLSSTPPHSPRSAVTATASPTRGATHRRLEPRPTRRPSSAGRTAARPLHHLASRSLSSAPHTAIAPPPKPNSLPEQPPRSCRAASAKYPQWGEWG